MQGMFLLHNTFLNALNGQPNRMVCGYYRGCPQNINVWAVLPASYSLGFLEKAFQIIMAHLYKTVARQTLMLLRGTIPTIKSQKQTEIPSLARTPCRNFLCRETNCTESRACYIIHLPRPDFFPTSHNTNDKISYVVWAHFQPSVPVTWPPPQQLNRRKRA